MSISLPLFWLPTDLGKLAKDEVNLWKQGLGFYKRQASGKADELLGALERRLCEGALGGAIASSASVISSSRGQ